MKPERIHIPPGESMIFGGCLPPDVDPQGVMIEARWRCGGCDRSFLRRVPLLDANGGRISISCPFCEPDSIDGRDAVVTAKPRNRLRRWLDR